MAKTETTKPATIADVVNAIAKGTISPEDGAKLIASLNAPTKGRLRTIKLNQSGGLYVTDPTFKAYSLAKEKHYQAGVNLDLTVAKALFTNDELLAEVRAFLKSN